MFLVGLGSPTAEVAHVFSIVFANYHVHLGGAGEVEARLGVAQDLVEVRRHAPPSTLTVEQPEGECGTAEHVGIEEVGTQSLRERLGGETRALRQRLPRAQLPGDLEQVRRMVTGDQLVKLPDLVGQLRVSRWRSTFRHHGVPPVLSVMGAWSDNVASRAHSATCE